jgi:GTP cyclohydrolase II
MIKARLGDPIQIVTAHGDFFVRHIGVAETKQLATKEANIVSRGDVGKEGVVLSRALDPKSERQPFRVRLQSSCLFSESFWSTDCDCAGQLSKALEAIQKDGGVLIYLYEEGRGIGLRRKIEAIRLQQIEGRTTSNAFACLGLGPDPRDYDLSASVIKQLLGDEAEIELMSNNGHKEKQLRQNGIKVAKRTRLIADNLNDRQRKYLASKRAELGHDIPSEVTKGEEV